MALQCSYCPTGPNIPGTYCLGHFLPCIWAPAPKQVPQNLVFMPHPNMVAGGIMFSGCPSVCLSVTKFLRAKYPKPVEGFELNCTQIISTRQSDIESIINRLCFGGWGVKGQGHLGLTLIYCIHQVHSGFISWTRRILTKLYTHIFHQDIDDLIRFWRLRRQWSRSHKPDFDTFEYIWDPAET